MLKVLCQILYHIISGKIKQFKKNMLHWRLWNIHASSGKSLKVFEKSNDILYIGDSSKACIHHVGDLTQTGLLTRHCFISWQEVTDLAPGCQPAACQRIRVCSQGGVPIMGTAMIWISLLSETRCPLPLVFYTLETDEIVLQNTEVKCVSGWRAAHPFFSALITFNNL